MTTVETQEESSVGVKFRNMIFLLMKFLIVLILPYYFCFVNAYARKISSPGCPRRENLIFTDVVSDALTSNDLRV